jgi:hypothetical protein
MYLLVASCQRTTSCTAGRDNHGLGLAFEQWGNVLPKCSTTILTSG